MAYNLSEETIRSIFFEFSNGMPVSAVMAMYNLRQGKAYELKNIYDTMEVLNAPNVPVKPNVGNVVGVIGDTHFPFVRDGYMEFCYDTFKREGVTEVVHIGDIVDQHSWSRHDSEPDALSGTHEFELAKQHIANMEDMFGEWDISLVLGNHDLIVHRQMASVGLPGSLLLKSFGQLYNVERWDVCTSKVIDNVEYLHGIGCTGTLLTAQRKRRSCVFGHSHSKADIQTHASWDDRVFGMHVGCGFDDKSYAARYGKESTLKSIISCGIVKDGKHPSIHFMDL